METNKIILYLIIKLKHCLIIIWGVTHDKKYNLDTNYYYKLLFT